ncbi:hypothetical protein NDU88_006201 [Pleurodeles waltl]|uniref:Uncharacterized protein n=1 Tax=Pleurodeles waltl TaxID=8319 RepID=A0AAV7SNU4_PLEWA|nr:hypothetical protein NDU88_006201 [Pleurodeles waltl]
MTGVYPHDRIERTGRAREERLPRERRAEPVSPCAAYGRAGPDLKAPGAGFPFTCGSARELPAPGHSAKVLRGRRGDYMPDEAAVSGRCEGWREAPAPRAKEVKVGPYTGISQFEMGGSRLPWAGSYRCLL